MLLIQNVVRNATIYRDRPATIMGNRRRTWGEFADRVARAAAGLKAMGVAQGDRIGILALNSDLYLEATYAIIWAGGIVVPMNIRWSLEENLYSARDAGLKVLIADDTFADAAKGVKDAVRAEGGGDVQLIHMCSGEPAEGFESWNAVVEASEPVRVADVPYSEPAGIFYTGGTTGFPKGAVLSHTSLWSSAVTAVGELQIDNQVMYLHAAPMFHVADMALSNCTTVAGGAHCFIPAFTPADCLGAFSNYNVTLTILVPTMIAMMLDAPEFETADTSSLNKLIYGASPMPEPVLRTALEKLPHVEFTQGYGQTEMGPIVSLLPHKYHALEGPNSKLRSAGRPIACVQVRIVDEDGKAVERGTAGEIRVRGPNALNEYWNKPEQTADTIVNGWVKTGDVAYMDEDGFLYICDRAKDMIITGGENVFSAEVENAAVSHPKVGAVAVIGVPDDEYGERVHAVVVPADGQKDITQEELYEHCHEHIAGYKCPRSIEIRREPLPLSGAGKVLKKDLRAPYWEGKQKGVA